MNKTNGHSKAFTIVELLIVIVVIAILTAVVVVGYNAVIANANDRAVQADLTKISDAIKLKSLDDNAIPSGGATSSNTGDSTNLPGVTFKPTGAVYDTTVANFFYCEGTLNGNDEFAIAARSKSGKAFSYLSSRGISDFSGYTWSTSNNGVALCTALGFSAPFTWSYGYNPNPSYGWFAWAYSGTILTNLISNPSMESNITGWANYSGFSTLTRVTTTPWVGSARLSAVGTGTVTTPRVYINVPATPGTVYSLVFRVRSDGQTPVNAFFNAKLINGTTEISTFYSHTSTWTPDSNGWVKGTGTFTLPSGGDGVRLAIGLTSSANYTGTMGIDGVMLVSSDTVPEYADGNTARWSWTGTTNNSTSSGPAL